jgi:predicted rRNA methylase
MLKKKAPKTRRSHRSSTEHQGIFIVDSMGAVAEFLRHRPQVVTRLRADKKHTEYVTTQFADVLRKHHLKVELSVECAIEASVKVESIDIDRMMSAISVDRSECITILACDHITDPRNFGAILRSAAFFGVRYVIVPRDRQVSVTQSVVATSMGALAHVDIVEVTNLARALRELSNQEFDVVGTDMDGDVISSSFQRHTKTVIVLGSEDRGISRLVKECCSRTLRIEGAGTRIESLNVAVAAGIVLHFFFTLN